MVKRHKCGDLSLDGKVFWAYGKGYAKGEYWVSADKFKKLKEAKAAKLRKLKSKERTLKRGDNNSSGMIFWGYRAGCINGELWVSSDKFEQMRQKQNAQSKIRYRESVKHAKKTLSRGYVRPDGKVFLNYDGAREVWVSSDRYEIFKEKSRASLKEYRKNRCERDAVFKLSIKMRGFVRDAINRRGYGKNSKTEKIIGCSFSEFREYLESQFDSKMNWDNFGEWHMDHILPISAAKTEAEVIALNHYTNFQPLWAADNMAKHDKHDKCELSKYLASRINAEIQN